MFRVKCIQCGTKISKKSATTSEGLCPQCLNKKEAKKQDITVPKPAADRSIRLALSWEDADNGLLLKDRLNAFLRGPDVANVEKITLGAWEEPYEQSCQDCLDLLCDNAESLTALKELFIGDMEGEECEISWIIQGNYSRIFTAFPELEKLHIKGANGLVLGNNLHHSNLKELFIESGGLGKNILQQIATADFGKLDTLKLYLGDDNYGFDATIDDLAPFFKSSTFPALKYLGLMDSEISDEIATALNGAEILDQLDILDLSLGTLSDAGAQTLLNNLKIKRLSRLNLAYHFMSTSMMNKIQTMGIEVDVSDQQEDDDGYRFPAVTE